MRAYSRRHRRWRNRNAQPLMLVADGPGLLDALAAFSRLLHRYRSELAPFTTGTGLEAAAMWLHHAHPVSWRWELPVSVSGVGSATTQPRPETGISTHVHASRLVTW